MADAQSRASAVAGPLLDRAEPIARLVHALDAACGGRGSAVVIEGDPGVGKTVLLGYAAEMARVRGLTVLAARGGELEHHYPYGIVRQLFEGLLVAAERREALLAGAAALAAPVLESHSGDWHAQGPSKAAFAAEHGLYWLAAGLAAEAPLLLVIDDAQWADVASMRWLAYLARRLDGLDLAVVVAARPAGFLGVDSVLAALTRNGLAELVEVTPLGVEAVATLVRGALGEDASDAFCEACREVTSGNPLLLSELVRIVVEERVVPRDTAGDRLHELASGAIGRGVLQRFAGLPAGAGALAEAVAVLGADAELRHAARLAGLELAEAGIVADRLAAAGLLEPGRPLRFSHPIVRSALYADLADGRRAALHARAAHLLDAEGQAAERVAVHVLACERAGDDWAVRRLCAAAAEATGRAAPDAAVVFLRRALEEPPAAAARPGVLRALGVAEGLAHDPGAAAHLRAALGGAEDVRERAAIALELARVDVPRGHVREAVESLDEAIGDLGPLDGELSLRLEATLIGAALSERALQGVAHERLGRVGDPPRGDTVGERLLLTWVAFERLMRGAPVAEVAALAERALHDGRLLTEQTADSQSFTTAANVLMLCDELERGHRLFSEGLTEAQARGSMIGFAISSCFRAWPAHRLGRLLDAEADLVNATRVAADGALEIIHGYALAFLAGVLVDRGEVQAARDTLSALDGNLEQRPLDDARFLMHARGRVALASGSNAQAARDLLACGRREFALGNRNPAWIPWRSDAATALAALGQREKARQLAIEEVTLARGFGAQRVIGVALRGLALVEPNPRRIELLEDAVAVLARCSAPLDHARALVSLGGALRAARRRTDARRALREGLDLAARCGAGGLVAEARRELIADGARPRRDALRGRDALTASEHRTARMAADGLSNREIAQALFVTTKTVETHLGSAYTKLAIRSRTQLPDALAHASVAALPPAG